MVGRAEAVRDAVLAAVAHQQHAHVGERLAAVGASLGLLGRLVELAGLPVGALDVPGHHVRVYEIQRTFPNNPPMINGVAMKEQWTRAISDYTDNNGPGTTYGTYVLENGDKFFTRSALVAQSTAPGKLTASTVGTITGGTGKFSGMQGTVRTVNIADPKAGVNEGQTELEFTISK